MNRNSTRWLRRRAGTGSPVWRAPVPLWPTAHTPVGVPAALLRATTLVALALLVQACGGGGGGAPGVATAESGTVRSDGSVSPAPSGAVAAYVQAQRNLAKCLRGRGFDVPDPDARGRLDLSVMGGARKADPLVRAAWEACKEFNVPLPAELDPDATALTPEQLANRRNYAKCMRANGMPRWPDPRADGSWPTDTTGELTPQEQAANISALQICEPVLDGRPPTTPDPHRSGVG